MNYVNRNKYFIIIFTLGLIYTLYQLTFIKDEVFFSGNGGLKALMTKQFLRGEYHADLKLDVPSWVQDLYDNGLYLFEAPYVYRQNNKYYMSFDLLFPLLHVPMYKWFGWRGFHIVPMICAWIIWILFFIFCKAEIVEDKRRAITLAILIFASFLSLFSVTYWEHTLAIALAFGGVILLTASSASGLTTLRCVAAGFLIGLSVWFRPELYCFVGAMTVVPFIFKYINWGPKQRNAFYITTYFMLISFWILNYYLYGHPLGVHSYQIIAAYSLFGQVKRYFKIFVEQGFFILMYFPFFIFYAFSILILFKDKSWDKIAEFRFFTAINFLMIVTTPIITPNHGVKLTGPRFVLIMLPFICKHGVLALKRIVEVDHKLKKFAVALFVICALAGVHRDFFVGTLNLKNDFEDRISPSLNYLRYDRRQIVVAEHQFIPQELEAALDLKTFFRAKGLAELEILIPALDEKGYSEFLYYGICITDELRKRHASKKYFYYIKPNAVYFRKIGDMGDYCVFEAFILD